MLDDSVTRVLDRASKRKRRMTHNCVARYSLEDCDFVSVPKVSFAAFVIEYDDVVGELLFVVHYNFRAALAKGLDNLSRLGTGPAMRLGGEGALASTCGTAHLPRFAIRNEDARFFSDRRGQWRLLSAWCSGGGRRLLRYE